MVSSDSPKIPVFEKTSSRHTRPSSLSINWLASNLSLYFAIVIVVVAGFPVAIALAYYTLLHRALEVIMTEL